MMTLQDGIDTCLEIAHSEEKSGVKNVMAKVANWLIELQELRELVDEMSDDDMEDFDD